MSHSWTWLIYGLGIMILEMILFPSLVIPSMLLYAAYALHVIVDKPFHGDNIKYWWYGEIGGWIITICLFIFWIIGKN